MLNLLFKLSANRKNNILTAKCGKLALSAAADAAVGEYVPATTDDNDICEVEWDSPRPLSGDVCYCVLSIGE